jgi:hypothetical protein
MIDAATTKTQEPTAKEMNTDDGGNSMKPGVESDVDQPAAAMSQTNPATDKPSPQAPAQPAENAGPESAGFPPRRRGILLGTHLETPAAADDEKSLSWMATQAVKALNAVKASQLEQLQTLKAKAEMSEGEPAQVSREDGIDPEVCESAGGAGDYAPMRAESPVNDHGFTPSSEVPVGEPAARGVEDSQHAVPAQGVPAAARMPSTRSAPRRMLLIIGTLVVIGVLGYRHWSARNNAASELSTPSSAIIEPSGPAAGIDMTPPRVSAVAAPIAASGRAEPASVTGTAPSREPSPASPGAAITITHEPAAPGSTGLSAGATTLQPAPVNPPANMRQGESRPPAVPAAPAPASTPQVATPQAVPVNPPATVRQEESRPPAVPAVPAPASTPQVSTPQAVPVNPPATVRQEESRPPAMPATPAPASPPRVATPQAVPPKPVSQPRYPATGYGYYPPATSWQPYYRPAYPQNPVR